MSTATAAPAQLEAARHAARRRRDLTQNLEDAKADLLAADQDLTAATNQFTAPKSTVTLSQLEAARRHRDECASAVGARERALEEFNRLNPSEERLKELEKAEQVRAAELAARAIVVADGHDLTEFLSFMDQADAVFNRMTARRANSGGAGLLALEGVLVPRSFWKFAPGEYAVGGAECWISRRRRALDWLKSQNLDAPEPPAA